MALPSSFASNERLTSQMSDADNNTVGLSVLLLISSALFLLGLARLVYYCRHRHQEELEEEPAQLLINREGGTA